jgi:XRE family transcriptional regulator, regulator of sulfur utilization
MEMADRIRAARLAAGLTQEQLAQRAGVASVTISQIELGNRSPTLDTLMRVAAALEIPAATLLGTAA